MNLQKTICLIQSPTLPPQILPYTDLVASFSFEKWRRLTPNPSDQLPKDIATLAKEAQRQLGPGSGQVAIPPSSGNQTQKNRSPPCDS